MIAIYFNGPSAKKVLLQLNYVTWKLNDFVLEKKVFSLLFKCPNIQDYKLVYAAIFCQEQGVNSKGDISWIKRIFHLHRDKLINCAVV